MVVLHTATCVAESADRQAICMPNLLAPVRLVIFEQPYRHALLSIITVCVSTPWNET